MKRVFVGLLIVSCLLGLLGVASADPTKIISFGTMYAVDGPFLGGANSIRGIAGDDLAWKLERAHGWLSTDGEVHVVVRGLIFKNGDPNDEAVFKAVVSCLTENGGGTPTVNVATPGFPANAKGNSHIQATIELPNPCVAPIIFITPEDEGIWFAVTGFEKEEE